MNIELMKQLEDLKAQYQKLNENLTKQIDAKKNQYIYAAKKDFSNFFKTKGFFINSDSLSVTATYGELLSRLSHDDPQTDYFGCYFVFDLNLKSFNGEEYNIILNQNVPHLDIRVSTNNLNASKDSQLQKKIDEMRNSIHKLQDRLDNLNKETWNFYIKIPNTIPPQYSKSYASLYELLSSLIE